MRLALHFCDNSTEMKEERRRDGKKYVDCKSKEEALDYWDVNIVSLDLITESSTLGSDSGQTLEKEFTS